MLGDKKKILVILQSAMSIRNWVTTGALEKLSIDFHVTVVTPHAKCISDLDKIDIYRVEKFEGMLGSFFRKLYYAKHQKVFYKKMPQDSYFLRKKRNGNTIKLKVYYSIEGLLVFFNLSLLKTIWEYFNYSKGTESLLNSINPDVVLSTHAYSPYDWHFIFNAKKLGITITTHVHSWDNITTRPRLVFDYDKVLVWGSWMQDSVKNYNNTTSKSKIVGAPYIDFIKKKSWIKSRKYSLPKVLISNKRYVLVIGSSKKLFPDFIKSLPLIAKILRAYNSILVFRPYHDSIDDLDLIDTSNMIISKPGEAFSGSYTDKCIDNSIEDISKESIKYLNLMKYADIVITQASSSGIEAALIGTQTITFSDVSINANVNKSNLREFFFSEHNRRMSTCQDISYIENINDLECIIKKIYGGMSSHKYNKDLGFNRILDEDFNFDIKLSNEIEAI